jgi:hypothetical protein
LRIASQYRKRYLHRQEWEAELRSREALLADGDRLDWRNELDLLRRSLGVFWDAKQMVNFPRKRVMVNRREFCSALRAMPFSLSCAGGASSGGGVAAKSYQNTRGH